jgi:3-polyprenyl-4-hydroxybenzoate decarboxylase
VDLARLPIPQLHCGDGGRYLVLLQRSQQATTGPCQP